MALILLLALSFQPPQAPTLEQISTPAKRAIDPDCPCGANCKCEVLLAELKELKAELKALVKAHQSAPKCEVQPRTSDSGLAPAPAPVLSYTQPPTFGAPLIFSGSQPAFGAPFGGSCANGSCGPAAGGFGAGPMFGGGCASGNCGGSSGGGRFGRR